jgi:hypothetical protein
MLDAGAAAAAAAAAAGAGDVTAERAQEVGMLPGA